MRTALVVNPSTTPDLADFCAVVAGHCRRRGFPPPLVLETTVEDQGEGQAREAVAEGAQVVMSAGGDGTVMSVARGLAGTGVPLGLLPAGTGNLLARNLGLPLDLDAAVEIALTGCGRELDMGTSSADGAAARGFVVMAGLGFDAAMMDDAPVRLKQAVGWPAYIVSGLRHLRDRPVRVELRVDDGPWLMRRARAVVVGNVGMLQGGLQLLPDAAPDDGLLDVVVLSPRNLVGWLRLVVHLARPGGRPDPALVRLRGRRVEVRSASAQPGQLDGDPVGPVTRLVVEVTPGVLRVQVPDADHDDPGRDDQVRRQRASA